jgi:hypothetical protein
VLTESNRIHKQGGGGWRRAIGRRLSNQQSLRAEPSVIEPRIDEAVLNAVRTLGIELGGVSTLKSLSDLVGCEAVIKAVTMGYLAYNPMDLTVRFSSKGLALLRATTEEESQGGEGSG